MVVGRLQVQDGVVHVKAEGFEALDFGYPEMRSRDFH